MKYCMPPKVLLYTTWQMSFMNITKGKKSERSQKEVRQHTHHLTHLPWSSKPGKANLWCQKPDARRVAPLSILTTRKGHKADEGVIFCFLTWVFDHIGHAGLPYVKMHQVYTYFCVPLCYFGGFPGGSGGKESSYNEEDLGLIPGLGRSPGERHDNPLQYSCSAESPCSEDPVGLQSLGSQSQIRLSSSAHIHTCYISIKFM